MVKEILRFADFELDRGAFELRQRGRTLHLERIPLDLLFLLTEAHGRLVTRRQIIERIWGKDGPPDSESSINTAVGKLRRALDDDSREPRFVATISRKGYRFVGTVCGPDCGAMKALPPGAAPKLDQQHHSNSHSPKQGKPGPQSSSNAGMLSDCERKRRALRKIQRLGSSGLPMLPFAYTLFDISAEAIDQTDIHRIGERFGFWLCRNFDFAKWSGIYKQAVMDTAGRSGFVALDTFYKSAKPTAGFFVPAGGRHPDFISSQFFLPDFMRSSAWNEFFRPAGIDGALLNVLRDRDEIVGLYPLHRDGRMRTWGRTDIDFLRMAVPHIAHGLRTARQVAYSSDGSDRFSLFDESSLAVILMAMDGRVLALNDHARSIFEEIGVFDRVPVDAFGARSVKDGLEYVARVLRSIFFERGEPSFELDAPVARIYAHASGLVLKLRGFLTAGDPDRRYFTVIAEKGETEHLRLQRLMYRYGLSRREAELVLRLRYAPSTNQKIAAEVGIGIETVKTYFKRISEKLDLHGRKDLVRHIFGNASP